MINRFLLASATLVPVGCSPADETSVATADVLVDPAPFDVVTAIGARDGGMPLPPVETVASYAPSSPLYHSTELATAADGTVAIGVPRWCSVVLLDGETGRRERRIDACRDTGRGIDDLFWVDRDLLGVFDMSAREVRLFRRSGAYSGRVPVKAPAQGGTVTAAFPLVGASILATISYFQASGDERLIQWLDSGSTPRAAFLSSPPVALRSDLRFSFGVDMCVQQSPGTTPARFLAVNRWAHDVFVAAPDDSTVAWRSIVPREAYMHRGDDGLIVPMPGRFAVACGEDAGLAHRTVLGGEPGSEATTEGVLDWLSFTGELIARFDLGPASLFALSREIGLDSADRAYALVRDSAALRVLRQPLVRPATNPGVQ